MSSICYGPVLPRLDDQVTALFRTLAEVFDRMASVLSGAVWPYAFKSMAEVLREVRNPHRVILYLRGFKRERRLRNIARCHKHQPRYRRALLFQAAIAAEWNRYTRAQLLRDGSAPEKAIAFLEILACGRRWQP